MRIQSKFLHKNFSLLFTSFVIPVFICASILIVYSIRDTNKNIKDKLNQSLDISANNLTIYLDTASTIVQNTEGSLLILNRMLSNQDIDYATALASKQYTSFIDSYINTSPYIDSVYVTIANENDRIYTSSLGFINENSFFDSSWKETLPFSSGEISIGKRNKALFSFESPSEVLTVSKRFTAYDGGICIDLRNSIIAKMFDECLIFPTQSIKVLSEKSEVLSSNTNTSESHGKVMTFEKTIPIYNLLIRTSLPIKTVFRLLLVQIYPSIFLLFFLLALCAVVAYFLAMKNYRQIADVVDLFQRAEENLPLLEQKTLDNDIFSQLLQNILKMFIENKYMVAQKQIAEMQALQYQINPHFLYNSLQTINYVIQFQTKGRRTKANQMIEDLSDIIRYSLGSPEESVTIRKEIENCKKYISIQEVRFDTKYKVLWDVNEGVMDYKIQRLILQPLIENSITHGLRGSKNGIIKIHINAVKNRLYFYVYDNGKGIDEDNLVKIRASLDKDSNQFSSSYIGLENCNRRLRLEYSQDSRIQIFSKANRFTVVLFHIPYATQLIDNE